VTVLAVAFMTAAAFTVAAMHEQVDDRARQREQIRHGSKDVRSVLLPQEEERDRQE
jgi:hypothetical protein